MTNCQLAQKLTRWALNRDRCGLDSKLLRLAAERLVEDSTPEERFVANVTEMLQDMRDAREEY